MKSVLVTGAAGLVGLETARRFHDLGYKVVGIDNDMRSYFFGPSASTALATDALKTALPRYCHHQIDIRDRNAVETIFQQEAGSLQAVVHCAAQPSHDWASRDPVTDFSVNAIATLDLLEFTRRHSPDASFIFMSTNKVYGDRPNAINLTETATRWTPTESDPWSSGVSEQMPIDQSMHSLFGVSKLSADLMVQEYGRYFGMNTVCFRGGCLTGPMHSGAELHGFLSYLVKCGISGRPYTIFGYRGKQVRDNIHTSDLVSAFMEYLANPKPASVYNIGGGNAANVSILEAIELIEQLSGRKIQYSFEPVSRKGDHKWYITDYARFKNDYPQWNITRSIESILEEMIRYEIDQPHILS